jgi:hypothetical protein
MDSHPYYTSRSTATYPTYASTSGVNTYDYSNSNAFNRDPRYTDAYGRSMGNPLPTVFRTAAMTSNAPTTRTTQMNNYRPPSSNSMYNTSRNYGGAMASGYISDTNDQRRSTAAAMRPNNTQTAYKPSTQYNTKYSTSIGSNDQNYYSDSECVTSGPRYYKISRQANTSRRPSNVVLPIRSMTSKAYDQYVPAEPPKAPKQEPFDVYRYQQEQQRLERERQLYEQQQAAEAARLKSQNQESRRQSNGKQFESFIQQDYNIRSFVIRNNRS